MASAAKATSTVDDIATTRKEMAYYRKGCYETLLAHFDTHVQTGLVEESDLCTRIKNPATTAADLRAQVKEYFDVAKDLAAAASVPPAHWAGETEIKATVYWFREPMLVYDKGETGTIFAWLYHMALTAPRDGEAPRETVSMTRLSLDEATAWLRRFEDARVIPLVIVLRRFDGTTYGNHFNGLRIRAHLYAEWAGSAKKRTRMAQRRRLILEQAGLYVPPAWNPLESSPPRNRETQTSDSTYIPTESEQTTESTPAPSSPDQQPWPQHAAQSGTFPDSFTGESVQSFGLSPSGTPLFPASMVTPQSPLSDSDYMMLLSSGKLPQKLVPQHMERWLKKAIRDNQVAYVQWKRTTTAVPDSTAALLSATRTIEDACDLLLSSPAALVDMLHALPYVPVVFARIDGLLQRLGKELLILGRTSHLREIIADEATPPAAEQVASAWLTAIEACASSADSWTLANSATRWGRLRRKLKNQFKAPERTLARVSDTEWGELIAHMLVQNSSLPPALREIPIAARCRHLVCWTAASANAETARAGVAAFTNGGWTFPSELFHALAVAYTPLDPPPPLSGDIEAAGATRN
jgi:hypothetical protein